MHTTETQTLEIMIDIEDEALLEGVQAPHVAENAARFAAINLLRNPAAPLRHNQMRHGGILWERQGWTGGSAYIGYGPSGNMYRAWGLMKWTVVSTDAEGRVLSTSVRRSRNDAFDVAAAWESATAAFSN